MSEVIRFPWFDACGELIHLQSVHMTFPSLAHVIEAMREPLLFKSIETILTQKQRFPSPVEEIK